MPNPLLSSRHPAWQTIRALIGGVSAIDVHRLPLRSLREAEDFLLCYGFDCKNDEHITEMEELRTEAIAFIEEELLNDEPNLKIHPEVRAQPDVRVLLRWTSTSGSRHRERQMWACAMLRLMHTLSHCHSHLNIRYGDLIRTQILDRFEAHLSPEEPDGARTLGRGPGAVRLARFLIKKSKPTRSLAMKLLHKPENVAADIFDRVGVRFVTKERLDTLFVVDYLRTHHVVMFANVKPSRSRNTLIDLDWLVGELERLEEEVRAGRLARYERLQRLRELTQNQPFPAPPQPNYNTFSSVAYHSIQFTCRQMIRIPGEAESLHEVITSLAGGDDASQRLAEQLTTHAQRLQPIRFFFPFEVQILDEESYRLSREGLAAHHIYKARQREAVKQRVLGRLLNVEPAVEVGAATQNDSIDDAAALPAGEGAAPLADRLGEVDRGLARVEVHSSSASNPELPGVPGLGR